MGIQIPSYSKIFLQGSLRTEQFIDQLEYDEMRNDLRK